MTPFEVQGPTRTCAATGSDLAVGARFYGVLLEEAGKFVRKDYSVDAWSGPPPNAIAYWSGRIPASDRRQKPTINDGLLLDWFDHLSVGTTDPNRLNFRYVVALLLMRRKRLKFEDSRRNSDGEEVLVLRDARTGVKHQVVDPRLNDDDITAVQDEVFRVLGWE